MLLLFASLLALLLAPLLYHLAARMGPTMAAFDGFVLAALGGLVLFQILPHSLALGGWGGGVAALLGLLAPGWVESLGKREETDRFDALLLPLALLALGVHSFMDGTALVMDGSRGDGGSPLLPLAVLLHQFPVGLGVWWLARTHHGSLRAGALLGGMAAVTVAGFLAGEEALSGAQPGMAWFQAAVAGSLLHVTLHRPHHEHALPDQRRDRWASGLGAGVAVALLLIASPDAHSGVPPWVAGLGSGETFWALAMRSSPSLAGGLLSWEMGRWWKENRRGSGSFLEGWGLKTGNRILEAMGTAAPPTSDRRALGFLAGLLSLPLLGGEWTGAWLGAAAVGALLPLDGSRSGGDVQRKPSPPREDFLDPVFPPLLAGLLFASLLESSLPKGVLDGLSPWDLLLFPLLASLLSLHPLTALPLATVLIHKGLTPGAALLAVTAGPRMSRWLRSPLSGGDGVSVPSWREGAAMMMLVGIAVGMNAWLPPSSPLHPVASPSWLETGALAVLAALALLSLLRMGARGWVESLISPHPHEHDHLSHSPGRPPHDEP